MEQVMKIDILNMKDNTVEALQLGDSKKIEVYYSPRNITSTKQLGDSYACKTNFGDNVQYTVYGTKGGRFYNPWANDLRASAVARTHEWIKVNKLVFDNYLQFLNTNKDAFLTEAEHRFIYG